MWHAHRRYIAMCYFVVLVIYRQCYTSASKTVDQGGSDSIASNSVAKDTSPGRQEHGSRSVLLFSNMLELIKLFEKPPTDKTAAQSPLSHETTRQRVRRWMQLDEFASRVLPDFVYTSDVTPTASMKLKCPNGHIVSIISARGMCGSKVVSLKGKAWKICANQQSCELEPSIIVSCASKAVLDPVTYTCLKVYAMDCLLFHSIKDGKKHFCFHMCMHFLRECQSDVIYVSRQERANCLSNLFANHVLNQTCSYVLNEVETESVNFNKKDYFDEKYEIGTAKISNKKWMTVKLKKRIENPVIFTSIPSVEGFLAVVLIENVTTAEFRISLAVMSCVGVCKAREETTEAVVKWLAITTGDHSPDLSSSINVGSLEFQVDKTIQLPLDPQKSWVVLAQVQHVEMMNKLYTARGKSLVVIPIVFKKPYEYIVRIMVPSGSIGNNAKGTIAYAAFENTEDIHLYNVGIKPFLQNLDSSKTVHFTVKLPYAWHYPTHIFGSTIATTRDVSPELSHYTFTLSQMETTNNNQVIKMGYYDFSVDLEMANILEDNTLSSKMQVNGIIMEEISSALRRKICTFAKNTEYVTISNACYDECMGVNGIRKCITAEDLLSCYNDLSGSCSLNQADLKDLPKQYVDYVRQHPEENEIPTSPTKALALGGKIAQISRKISIALKSSPITMLSTQTQPASTEEQNDAPNEEEKEVEIIRNCIEGPWGEWSECSSKCVSEKITARQNRKRTIYANNVGSGTKSCVHVESRPCEGIPHCSNYCLSRLGAGKGDTFQQQYYYIWSENCINTETIKLSIGYTPGAPLLGGGVSVSGGSSKSASKHAYISKGNNASTPLADTNPECNNPHYWSSCNAPCRTENGEAPLEYLKASIACQDNRRPCSSVLRDCKHDIDTNEPESHGTCILKHAHYDLTDGQWSKNGSCICEEGVPCTADEMYLNADYSEITSLERGSQLETKLRFTPYQSMISLANGETLQLPWGPVLDVTYGRLNEKEADNYCASGTAELAYFEREILFVDCRLAVSKNNSEDDNSCKLHCSVLRKKCEADVKAKTVYELAACLKDRLDKDYKNIHAIGFKSHNCRSPNIAPGLNSEEEICKLTAAPESSNKTCVTLCGKVLSYCKMVDQHERERLIRTCMIANNGMKNTALADSSPKGFDEKCKYKKAIVYGSGLVYCKKKEITCDLEEWSEWDDCSGPCITVNAGNNIVPQRSRKRKLKSKDHLVYRKCVEKGIHFTETVECLWLPQCPEDDVITNEIVKIKQHIAWEAVIPTRWDLQSWVLADSYDKDATMEKECNIFRGERNVSNNKIIYERSRCSCPPFMKPCSIRESVNSYRWFDMLELLCKQNEMRSVLFNQKSGFYRYSCSIKTFIKEDFDSHRELCNELDGTTFVSCSGESLYTHIYIFCTLSLAIGALTAILIFVYTYNRTSFV